MPGKCAALHCRTGYQGAVKVMGVTLHSFPWKKPELLNQWKKNLSREDYLPTKNSRLCSLHFEDDCFETTRKRKLKDDDGSKPLVLRRLKGDAVPTIFDIPAYLVTPTAVKRPTAWTSAAARKSLEQSRHDEAVEQFLETDRCETIGQILEKLAKERDSVPSGFAALMIEKSAFLFLIQLNGNQIPFVAGSIQIHENKSLSVCINGKPINKKCFGHVVKERENYVAQTGDPTGTGKGGESVFRHVYGDQARYFEMEGVPKLRHKRKGTVSMVNNGSDEHGSQFFVTLADDLDYLDGKHTVFGQVNEGVETLEKLNLAICDEKHRPYQDIRIAHTMILDDPFDDPRGLDVPSRSPVPTKELISSHRIAVDEDVNDTEGKTEEQIQTEIELKDTRTRAQILEMLGDLHHAEEKPPDNVLFVCKLNPVTTEEDLEIIFARFGAIKCSEVIKDKRTGASLQYAFIEFEKMEDCENAYFKMDNVLIDDRRIHVDFSQSVAKNYQWKRQVDGAEKTRNDERDEGRRENDNRRRERRSTSRSRNRHGSDSGRRRHEGSKVSERSRKRRSSSSTRHKHRRRHSKERRER